MQWICRDFGMFRFFFFCFHGISRAGLATMSGEKWLQSWKQQFMTKKVWLSLPSASRANHFLFQGFMSDYEKNHFKVDDLLTPLRGWWGVGCQELRTMLRLKQDGKGDPAASSKSKDLSMVWCQGQCAVQRCSRAWLDSRVSATQGSTQVRQNLLFMKKLLWTQVESTVPTKIRHE